MGRTALLWRMTLAFNRNGSGGYDVDCFTLLVQGVIALCVAYVIAKLLGIVP